MKFFRKFFPLPSHHTPSPTHRIRFLLFALLIAILDGVSVSRAAAASAATTTNGIYQEYSDRQQDVEPRQFGGFNANANAAFNSNFASSNFGLNLGGVGGNSGFGNSPTTPTPFNIPSYTTTNTPHSNINFFNNYNNKNNNNKDQNKNTYNDYNQKNPNVGYVDRFNHRYPDGSYEYRYELSDGTARYERGYFLLYDNKKTLVVVGYYSYRMPDGRYITVFYNADQNGYRQNQSITPQGFPNLPRSIDIPQYRSKDTEDEDHPKATTTSPRHTTSTTKRGTHF